MRTPPIGLLFRLLLPLVGLVGAGLLALSSFASVVEIDVLTTNDIAADVDTRLSGLDRHGPSYLVMAAFGLVMLAGAVLRGARPAMFAVAVVGAVALGIAGLSDGPKLDDTGQVGQLYEDASAKAGAGFYLESLGGALLLLSGGGMLLLGAPTRPAPRTPRPRRSRPAGDEDEAPRTDEPTVARAGARPDDDWLDPS